MSTIAQKDSKGRFLPGNTLSSKSTMIADVRKTAKIYTSELLEAMVKIALDPNERGQVRVTAAEAVLNRAWGTPERAVHITSEVARPAMLDTAALQALISGASGGIVDGEIVESEASSAVVDGIVDTSNP